MLGRVGWQYSAARTLALGVVLGMLAGSFSMTIERPHATAQTPSPSISLSETSGLLGRAISITGSGFEPNEAVSLHWRSTFALPTTTVTSSSTGTFAAPFTLPDAPNGPQTIFANGHLSGREASAVYTVIRTAGLSSQISEGVYSVYATRIGLVGNTTSSGHLVREHDYFVALPACTSTNCPDDPGFGTMTDCASKCYVKIINPQTKACRVEPILDVGPWFRVDDWWNPAGQRYLNNLSSNPTFLAQGYPASDAARNGYNVGYGIGTNGFGNDDTGSHGARPVREVGNRAAIDLADGTWRSLDLTSDGTGARIRVELLWQSGADPDAQAQACGHPLNQAAPLSSPTATPIVGSNPEFSGERLPIVASAATTNSSAPTRAFDENQGTSWSTISTSVPDPASVTFDLGQEWQLTGIRWMYRVAGGADRMRLQISTDGANWTQLVTTSNRVPHTWEGWNTTSPARYVRFVFDNPNGSPVLGYLAEVEVWGPIRNAITFDIPDARTAIHWRWQLSTGAGIDSLAAAASSRRT